MSDPSISELVVEIRELRAVVERSLRVMRKVQVGQGRSLSLRAVARAHNRREATVREDYRSGLLGPGKIRGRGIYVSAKRAEEHYGA